MQNHQKFDHFIEKNCDTILNLIALKGLSVSTLKLLYNHFTAQSAKIESKQLDCEEGCGFCCHLRVSASVVELLIILAYLKEKGETEAYRQKLSNKSNYLAVETSPSYWAENRIPCLFLDKDKMVCKIYEVRPFSCRGYHSLNVEKCRQGYEEKRLCQIPCYPDLKRANESFSLSFERAMKKLGKESGQTELSSGIHHLLLRPDSTKKWLAGKSIFDSNMM